MIRRICLSVIALAVLAPSLLSQNVDEIIAKYIQARGGADKLKAVQSIKTTATMTMGPGMELAGTVLQKRPMLGRMEFTVQGMTAVQAYDGKDGWDIMPFQGKKDAEPMAADDVKNMELEADIDGPLIDYKTKGNTVEYLGKDKVEGSDAYKLKVTRKNGIVETLYVDSDTGLIVKAQAKLKVRGNEMDVESTFSDFRTVDGLVFPFAIEQGAAGGTQKQKITVEKIEVNPDLNDSQFHMPAAAPAESKPAEKPGTGR